MSEEIHDSYRWACRGIESNSEQEAWDTFESVLRHDLKWIKGFKYWRKPPKHYKYMLFDTSEERHIVIARIMAFEVELPEKSNFKKAEVGRPYPEYPPPSSYLFSFAGLAMPQEDSHD